MVTFVQEQPNYTTYTVKQAFRVDTPAHKGILNYFFDDIVAYGTRSGFAYTVGVMSSSQ